MVEGHDLAVDETIGEALRIRGDSPESIGPIESVACAKARFAIDNAQRRTVTVKFHLMRPAGRVRRTRNQLGQLRGDEAWNARY